MIRLLIVIISVYASLSGQAKYNHPELEWFTFETEHFNIHYHDGTERSAREAATVAEIIFPKITQFYDFVPEDKTDIILKDADDYSNGAAYYYDNNIVYTYAYLNAYKDAYKNQLYDFAKFIKKNIKPLALFEEGRRALIMANAAKKSITSKRIEKLNF